MDPVFPAGDRGPVFDGVHLRRGCFSVKMGVKMKELGPVGGRAPENFVCRSASDL